MAASKVFPVTAALPSIFYEDPEPVEDGMQQAPIIFRVVSMLMEHFKGNTDVFVSGGGFIFYDPANGNRRIAPDLFIAFDVDVEGIRKNLPNYLDLANRQATGLRAGSGLAEHGVQRSWIQA